MNTIVDQTTSPAPQTTTTPPLALAAPVLSVATNIICLKPRPLRPNFPAIDQGTALLANQSLTTPDELIHGLLHKATKGVLAGSSKTGKTWVLLDLAICVSTGTPFLKWNTTKGKVLFVNMEINKAFLKQRLLAMVEKKGIDSIDNLDIWTLRGQSADTEALLEGIVERAQDGNYALIILDPIYKLMVGRSENTASGVGLLCHHVERLMIKTGAAVMYAHHFTKGSQSGKKAMDRMSGSGVFARDADTILTLTEHKEECCYNVEMILRNLPPQPPFVVDWQYPVMVQRPDLEPDQLGNETEQDELEIGLLGLLDGKALTTTEWQQAATNLCSKATFHRRLKTLKATGKARCDDTSKTWEAVADETDETDETGETKTVISALENEPVIDFVLEEVREMQQIVTGVRISDTGTVPMSDPAARVIQQALIPSANITRFTQKAPDPINNN